MKLSEKQKSELPVALCFLVPPLYALYEIQTHFVESGMHTGGGVSNAALFPRLISILLIIITAVKILMLLFLPGKGEAPSSDRFSLIERGRRKSLFLMFLTFTAFLVSLSILGYYVATPLALAVFFILLGVRNGGQVISLSLGVTVLMWFVFSQLLQIVLPVGRFGLYF